MYFLSFPNLLRDTLRGAFGGHPSRSLRGYYQLRLIYDLVKNYSARHFANPAPHHPMLFPSLEKLHLSNWLEEEEDI